MEDEDTYLPPSTWRSNYDFRECRIIVRSSNWWRSCDWIIGWWLDHNMWTFSWSHPSRKCCIRKHYQVVLVEQHISTTPEWRDGWCGWVLCISTYSYTYIESFLMPNTLDNRVHLMYLLLLVDLNKISNHSWGSVVLVCFYNTLDHGIDFN